MDGEEDDGEMEVERFHHSCFRCGNCGDSFGELDGKANFVRENGKPVHISVSLHASTDQLIHRGTKNACFGSALRLSDPARQLSP